METLSLPNLLIICALSMSSVQANADEPAIYIESMSNPSNVAILGTQISNNVKPGQVLDVGNRVQTRESGARIVYPDGSMITLGKNSEIEIKKNEEDPKTKKPINVSVFKMGFVHARVHHQDGESPHFIIETRTAVAGVRGTEFTMNTSESGETIMHVLEGKIIVAADRSKLETGQGLATGQLVNSKGGAIAAPEVFNLAEYRKALSLEHPEVHKLIYNKIKTQSEATLVRRSSRRHKK